MKNRTRNWSRRKFISTFSAAGAALALKPVWTFAENKTDPAVVRIVANTIGIDAHNHIDVPLDKSEMPGPQIDLAGEMKKSGLSAIVMTFATDYKRNVQPGESYERFLNGLTGMDAALADNKMQRSLNADDIKRAHSQHIPTVVQSVEGCHFLEGKIERLEIAYQRGLRHLGLLHDSDASVPLGDVYTNPPQFGGLTDFGVQVIKESNRMGLLIDLTHASDDTINAALKVTTKPVIISHTGLDTRLGNDAFIAKMMRPRLISAKQAKIVADAGGVIGIWTHLSDTQLEYAQNIRAMVDIVGVDHVCIGTDTKLTTPFRSSADTGGKGNGQPPQQKEARPDSIAQRDKTEKKSPPRFRDRTNEAWDTEKEGFYYTVVAALLKTGFTENDIAKIGGGNYLRVFGSSTSLH